MIRKVDHVIVKGYDFTVYSDGRVFLNGVRGTRALKMHLDRDGYWCYRKNDIRVNRLVAYAFGKLDKYEWDERMLVVDHINRDRTDNRLCNLRVCTIAENRKNADNALMGLKHRKPIIAICPDGTEIKFDSTRTAARELGLSERGITNVLKGRRKTLHKYKFVYDRKEGKEDE